jgi:hypothetical protein
MDIHTKKWKKLLKKTRITADLFIDEIRGNLKLERNSFRLALCPEIFPWANKKKIFFRVFLRLFWGKVSSSFGENVNSY